MTFLKRLAYVITLSFSKAAMKRCRSLSLEHRPLLTQRELRDVAQVVRLLDQRLERAVARVHARARRGLRGCDETAVQRRYGRLRRVGRDRVVGIRAARRHAERQRTAARRAPPSSARGCARSVAPQFMWCSHSADSSMWLACLASRRMRNPRSSRGIARPTRATQESRRAIGDRSGPRASTAALIASHADAASGTSIGTACRASTSSERRGERHGWRKQHDEHQQRHGDQQSTVNSRSCVNALRATICQKSPSP